MDVRDLVLMVSLEGLYTGGVEGSGPEAAATSGSLGRRGESHSPCNLLALSASPCAEPGEGS